MSMSRTRVMLFALVLALFGVATLPAFGYPPGVIADGLTAPPDGIGPSVVVAGLTAPPDGIGPTVVADGLTPPTAGGGWLSEL